MILAMKEVRTSLILILHYYSYFSDAITPPRVQTPLGVIEGDFDQSLNGRTFYSFLGVPYAKPPVGNLRFQEPQPITEPWTGTWIAKSKYECLQYNQFSDSGENIVEGDEDCLYANIFTPTLEKGANLDVIVFLPGGAFMFHSAYKRGPNYLLDEDVVVVTVNYRLGPLGFLSTEDEVLPGNNGLRDQILALKWVQENVEYFGGNPDSVTLTGSSAGGASVHIHFLSPKSEGLFHRGISQSGVALNPWVLVEGALEKTRRLATLVGCPIDNSEIIVNCLRSRPGKKIFDKVKEFQSWLDIPVTPFGPVVDTWALDPVLPDHPYNLLANGKVQNLPWITSFTTSEGMYPAIEFYHDHLKTIDSQWNSLMPFILVYDYTVEKDLQDEVSQKIREEYLGNGKVTKSTFMDFVKILSDRLFLDGIERSARLQAAVVDAPIFLYYFRYRGAHSLSEGRRYLKVQDDFGSCHSDDNSYVFKSEMDVTTTEEDREMVKIMVQIFTSFAKNGVPNLDGIKWPESSKNVEDPLIYLRIDSPRKLVRDSNNSIGNLDFWDSLPITENKKFFLQAKDEL